MGVISRAASHAAAVAWPPRGSLRSGSRPGLEDRAEVGHVRAGAVLAADRRAAGDAEADLVEAAVEDVGAVAGAVHPAVDDVRRRGVVPAPPGDVLAERVAARALEVAGGLDAADEVAVREVVAPRHVVRVALRGEVEAVVVAQLVDAAAR